VFVGAWNREMAASKVCFPEAPVGVNDDSLFTAYHEVKYHKSRQYRHIEKRMPDMRKVFSAWKVELQEAYHAALYLPLVFLLQMT
jgi:hypothetical protein